MANVKNKKLEADLNELRLARDAVIDLATRVLVVRLDSQTLKLFSDAVDKAIAYRAQIKASKETEFVSIDGLFANELEREVLPALADAIFNTAPIPGERSDTGVSGTDQGVWLPLIELFIRICKQGRELCGNNIGGLARKELSQRLVRTSAFYHKHLMEQLNSGEHPDISGISADQLRLDILQWGLEELGDRTAMKSMRTQANATARAAIKSAERIVNTYFSHRGVMQDFEFTAVLAEVEELVVLINRIIEADYIADHEEPHIVHDLGHAVVAHFVDALGRAILAVFKDIEIRIHQNRLSPRYMQANLKKARHIYEFCLMVDRRFTDRIFTAVRSTIGTKSRELLSSFINMKEMGDDFPHVDENLRIMQDFLAEMNV